MPEFMVMILADEAEELAPAQIKALIESRSAYERKLRATSAYVDGERFRPSREGRRVRTSGVEVGPFPDKALTGYYIVRADSLEAANDIARECPTTPATSLEVRPVGKGKYVAEKASQQGRVFAFGVLGNAASEAAWIEAMDRVDASTNFPSDRFLGGVRLEARKRAVFDGPFLESKEVIGGLFFLRMSTLEEAVEWASQSDQVQHVTLEIRELWRS